MFKFRKFAATLCMLASTGAGTAALAQDASRGRPDVVIVLPFATLKASSPDAETLPSTACLLPQGAPPQTAEAIEATIPSDLPAELTTALAREIKGGGSAVYDDLRGAPPSALVIAGCIVRADPGDTAKRLVGAGMGASILAVHVEVYRGGQADPVQAGAFDIEVRGENKLPPIGPVGLVVHGVRGRKLNLAGDADKMAKLIAQRVLTGQIAS